MWRNSNPINIPAGWSTAYDRDQNINPVDNFTTTANGTQPPITCKVRSQSVQRFLLLVLGIGVGDKFQWLVTFLCFYFYMIAVLVLVPVLFDIEWVHLKSITWVSKARLTCNLFVFGQPNLGPCRSKIARSKLWPSKKVPQHRTWPNFLDQAIITHDSTPLVFIYVNVPVRFMLVSCQLDLRVKLKYWIIILLVV